MCVCLYRIANYHCVVCTHEYLLSPVNVGESFFIIMISEGQFHADHFRHCVRTSCESRQYTKFIMSVNFVQYFCFHGWHETWSYRLYIINITHSSKIFLN